MCRAQYKYETFFEVCYKSGNHFSFDKIYQAYLKTDRWAELRLGALNHYGHKCRMCPATATCVHHREYPRILGTETLDQLTPLCEACHHRFHCPPGVAEMRAELVERAATGEGTNCLVCKTLCKIHNRTLYANMVKHLIKMSRLPRDDEGYSRLGDDALGKEEMRNYTRAEYEKLLFWGFTNRRQDGEKRDGVWYKVTEKGWDFINSKIAVPRTAHVLNGKVLTFSGENITIREAFKTPFDYEQLMAGVDVEVVRKKRGKEEKEADAD